MMNKILLILIFFHLFKNLHDISHLFTVARKNYMLHQNNTKHRNKRKYIKPQTQVTFGQ